MPEAAHKTGVTVELGQEQSAERDSAKPAIAPLVTTTIGICVAAGRMCRVAVPPSLPPGAT
jgi:hypothetical protein